jgi:hypothetical protein
MVALFIGTEKLYGDGLNLFVLVFFRAAGIIGRLK